MTLLGRAADAGRLRVPVAQATRVIHAATTGATLALIGEAPSERDLTVSARLRGTVLAPITTDPPASSASDLASRALALDAALERRLPPSPQLRTPGCPCETPRRRCSANGSSNWQAEPGRCSAGSGRAVTNVRPGTLTPCPRA